MEANVVDVIVIGAGPAGSMAAYFLGQRGFKVMVFDKEVFPRHKICGGGLTTRTMHVFPFDLSPVLETSIRKFRFTHKYKEEFYRESPEPLMYCVMREKFDQFLINKAIEKGVEFMAGTKVLGITETFEKVLVHTSKGEFAGQFAIGADGPSSLTARTFQMTGQIKKGMGVESEIRVPMEDLEKLKETVYVDWGTFMEGYAWMFPKGNNLSVGVGGPASLAKYLKTYYFNFLQSIGIKSVEMLSFRTYPIPYKIGPGKVQAGRILLAGDAAGLTDPLTGEGIYFAAKSGLVAAETISEFLEGREEHPFNYRIRMEQEIIPELISAFDVKKIFNAVPGLIHHYLRKNNRLWRGFCMVLRGEITYLDFPSKLGRYKIFWKPAIRIAGWVVKLKLANFKLKPGRVS